MITLRQLLKQAENKLDDMQKDCNVPKVLFYHLSNIEPHQLYLMMDDVIDDELYNKFNNGLERYINGEPIQYIIGKESFFSRDFIVNDKVLIPRYETEELVENILYHIDDYFNDYSTIDLVDIGTGSGAIAITLALEENKAKVIATDISKEALEVAKANCKNLDANVEFLQGDMLKPLIENNIKVDILISNPPYIPINQEIESVVKDNEPNVALFGGNDGLYFYRLIFKDAKKVLKDRAILAFEMGYDQKEIMEQAVKHYFPDCTYKILKDINGKDRMLFIYYNIEEI